MKKHHSLIGLGLAVGLFTIPAIGAHAAGESCFRTRDLNGFRSIDDRTVYIRVNGRDVYELKLFAMCQGITWSYGASLRSKDGNMPVCEGTAHRLEVYARSGGTTRPCQVREVRKLTPEEVAALPSRARP